jgi:hypothetical protein
MVRHVLKRSPIAFESRLTYLLLGYGNEDILPATLVKIKDAESWIRPSRDVFKPSSRRPVLSLYYIKKLLDFLANQPTANQGEISHT